MGVNMAQSHKLTSGEMARVLVEGQGMRRVLVEGRGMVILPQRFQNSFSS